jgi:hypothetical protein
MNRCERILSYLLVLAIAAFAPLAAAPAGAPNFTGYWQHSPILQYQPVPGSAADQPCARMPSAKQAKLSRLRACQ